MSSVIVGWSPGGGEAECPGSGDPMARPAEDGDTGHTAQSCTHTHPDHTVLSNTNDNLNSDLNCDLNSDLNNSLKTDLNSFNSKNTNLQSLQNLQNLQSLPNIHLPNSEHHFSSLRRINSVLEMLGASEGAVQHQPLQVGGNMDMGGCY